MQTPDGNSKIANLHLRLLGNPNVTTPEFAMVETQIVIKSRGLVTSTQKNIKIIQVLNGDAGEVPRFS